MFYHKIHIEHILLNNNKIRKQYKFQRNHRKGASFDAPFSFLSYMFLFAFILIDDTTYRLHHFL